MRIGQAAAVALLRRRRQAAHNAPLLTDVLRGTLRKRFIRCGKATCHCRKGRGHGPVNYLSVTLGVGQTRQITVASEDVDTARRYIQNYERVWRLLESISTINRELLQKRLMRTPRKQAPSSSAKSKRRRRALA